MSGEHWKSFGRGQSLMNVMNQSNEPVNNTMNMSDYTNEKIVKFLDTVAPEDDQGAASLAKKNDGIEKCQPTEDKSQSQGSEPKTKATAWGSGKSAWGGNRSAFPSKTEQSQEVSDKPDSFTLANEDFPPL